MAHVFRAVIFVGAATGGARAYLHLASLCRGYMCGTAEHPLLDYDAAAGKCVCRVHPCWEAGPCPKKRPHPHFHHNHHKELQCGCSKTAVYDSVHISRDKCAGHKCDKATHPILDYDGAQGCLCRAHPCWNDNGQRHDCTSTEFPLLTYREEYGDGGEVKRQCKCFIGLGRKKRYRPPALESLPATLAELMRPVRPRGSFNDVAKVDFDPEPDEFDVLSVPRGDAKGKRPAGAPAAAAEVHIPEEDRDWWGEGDVESDHPEEGHDWWDEADILTDTPQDAEDGDAVDRAFDLGDDSDIDEPTGFPGDEF